MTRYSAAVANPRCQTPAEVNLRSRFIHTCPSSRMLAPSVTGLSAFFGFIGFWLALSGPASMTIPRLSVLAALCLMLAGLCGWIDRFSSKAGEGEERFRVIADTAPVLIWMSGLDKRCTYFNTGWLDYTGRTMEEELGDGWVEGVHPEDIDRCAHIYSEAFDRRESFEMEYRLRKADGRYGWIHDRGVPHFLPDGTFAGYLGACIDVTMRRHAEAALRRVHQELEQRVGERTLQLAQANRSLQEEIAERKRLETELFRHTEELERQVAERTAEIAKLESQRAQTEKLAAMGRLAAGVAHEINNPIAGIKNAFTLVKQAIDPSHPHAEFADMIDREIARVATIVQNMYQLYRPESGKGEAVELRTMMYDIEALFAKRLQQRRLALAIDADPCLNRLCVPRGDLLQVLLNLLNNAVECSPEGGTVSLTLRQESDAIRIAVSDQGPGVAPENLPHIFEPFFTTKTEEDQKGMGLGLSISQSLTTAMGGKIEVQTRPVGGSTFSVLLPPHVAVVCARDNQSNAIKEVVAL